MRVTFVNRFYWPAEPATAQLLTDLAEGLAARGWQVAVITGRTAPALAERETRHGVTVHRVGPTMAHTQNLARRALDFAAFHLAAGRRLRAVLQPGDVAVALTDPPLLGVTVRHAAAARGARLVHWIHDIYPEVLHAVAPNPATACVSAALRPARNTAWRRAAACVTLGEDMAGVVRAAGIASARLHVVPNWAPRGVTAAPADAIAALRQRWAPGARFLVGYSGNLGRVHDLAGLVDVAEQLRDEAGLAFLFVGGGAGFARLQAEVARRRLTNVIFQPPQPRRELAVALGVPDVHVVSLREGCERFVFPSKLHGVVAVGRPVLALGAPGSEVARLVTARGIGAAFASRDAAGIASWLRQLAAAPEPLRAYTRAAVDHGRSQPGAPEAIAVWDELLRKLDLPG